MAVTDEFDFDRIIDRTDTSSVKWNMMHQGEDGDVGPTDRFTSGAATPMWVADMDFAAPPCVVEALRDRADHGVFGYSHLPRTYRKHVAAWYQQRHDWTIDTSWLCVTHGVVQALGLLVRTFTKPGDGVIIQSPVYYPFYSAVTENQAELRRLPLTLDAEQRHYRMDFDALERSLNEQPAAMLLLCNPHNPVGRVWTREELTRLGEICLAHNVLVIADEIHGDLALPPHRYTPFASISDDFAQHSVTCTAASKTFNLAGLHTSNLLIPNPDLRARFDATLDACGIFGANLFGAIATDAAYHQGGPWLDQLLTYLETNRQLVADRCEAIEGITPIPTEGTYLAWLDCRQLGMEPAALRRFMQDEAGIALDSGRLFGPDGAGFERLNFACPRPLLEGALDRLATACAKRAASVG